MDTASKSGSNMTWRFWIMVGIHLYLNCLHGNESVKECGGACPAGYFEAKPCTHFGNRVCMPCTRCEGSMYEVRSCSQSQDRQCIHAAHPLLISDGETTPTFLDANTRLRQTTDAQNPEWLKVDTSSNVISEDLHNTRNLETTFYVTDRTQASDFAWERDSGIHVNIGVSNVHVIPTYSDVHHESDNQFMLDKNNSHPGKEKFADIVAHHCRHPIPDSYHITLEVFQDRTTTAREVQCSNENPARPNCAPGYVEGDVLLQRDLNQPCEKMGTFPDPLIPRINSAVCTRSESLLSGVFRIKHASEHPITFENSRCKSAIGRCKQCLDLKCNRTDIFVSQCCEVGCYILADCKLANSAECSRFPVECGQGSAYSFTLMPYFQNIQNEFQCHVVREKPRVLYELFYSLEVPGVFQTETVYKTVLAGDEEFQSNGIYQSDYITVEHSTGLDLADEFILIGSLKGAQSGDILSQLNPYNVASGTSGRDLYRYKVAPLKTEDDYNSQMNKDIKVFTPERDRMYAKVQFARPFDYSAKTWTVGNQCEKDLNKIKPDQRHYSNATAQPVIVQTEHPDPFGAFVYTLKGIDNPPFIKITVPGNASILPWYFANSGTELRLDNTLQLELELQLGYKVWSINISGKMTSCPAYLGVTINNRENNEELIRQDLLITCPLTFNLTFHAPNIGQQLSRTFDVLFVDSVKSYQVFLTHLELPDIQNDVSIRASSVQRYGSTIFLSYTLVLTVLCLTVALVFVLNKVYIITILKQIKQRKDLLKSQENLSPDVNSRSHEVYSKSRGSCKASRCIFVCLYVVLRLMYSLMFSFTIATSLLMVFMRPQVERVLDAQNFTTYAQNSSRWVSWELDEAWRTELIRQAAKLTDMQSACSFYITELIDSTHFQMSNLTSHYQHHSIYSNSTSRSALFHSRVQKQLDRFLTDVYNFSERYQKQVDANVLPVFQKYNRFLSNIYANKWFSFPQWLYNLTAVGRSTPHNTTSEDINEMMRSFALFVELEEVELIRFWQTQFWERFQSDLTKIPDAPHPIVSMENSPCTNFLNNKETLQYRPSQLDSIRYFTPALPDGPHLGPVYSTPDSYEEYYFVTEETIPILRQGSFQEDDSLRIDSMIDVEMFWMIFLALDVLLFVYRFSNTYINAKMLYNQCRLRDEGDCTYATEYSGKTATENQYYNVPATNMASDSRHCYKHVTPCQQQESLVPLGEQPVLPKASESANHIRANGTRHKHEITQNKKAKLKRKHKRYNCVGSVYSYEHESECCTVFKTLFHMLLSSTLPKVLIGTLVLLLCYIIVETVHATFNAQYFVTSGLLNIYLSGLSSQVAETNWYLNEQANYFNNISMQIFTTQVRSELSYLDTMLSYFHSVQIRLGENYKREACAITEITRDGNTTCDVTTSTSRLQIPLLPCNFVPLLPHLLSGDVEENQKAHLLQELEPYLSSFCSLATVVMYLLLVAFCAMLVIHILGAVLMQAFGSTFPIQEAVNSGSEYPYIGAHSSEGPIGDGFPPAPITGDSLDYSSDSIHKGTLYDSSSIGSHGARPKGKVTWASCDLVDTPTSPQNRCDMYSPSSHAMENVHSFPQGSYRQHSRYGTMPSGWHTAHTLPHSHTQHSATLPHGGAPYVRIATSPSTQRSPGATVTFSSATLPTQSSYSETKV